MEKLVTLNERELQEVERARQDGVLAQLAGESANESETAALTALVRLGLKAVHEERQKLAYQAWAADMSTEDVAYRQAMRARNRGRAGG